LKVDVKGFIWSRGRVKVFPVMAVRIESRLLVDGSWAEAVSVRAARELGADFVIAVDVGDSASFSYAPRNTLDVIARADALVRSALVKEQLKSADFLLCPQNGVAHWADFSTAGQAIVRGEEEVDLRLAALRLAVGKAKWKNWWNWGAKMMERNGRQRDHLEVKAEKWIAIPPSETKNTI